MIVVAIAIIILIVAAIPLTQAASKEHEPTPTDEEGLMTALLLDEGEEDGACIHLQKAP